MQLDHSNGQVILLNKIDVNQNRVIYSRYDYGGENGRFLEQKALVFSTISLLDYLSQEVIFEELCYETIIVEVEPGYVIAEEVQNWLYPANNVRVYITALTMNQVANTDSPLYGLIEIYVDGNVARLLEGTHYYRPTVTDDERAVLLSYPGVQIEDKI